MGEFPPLTELVPHGLPMLAVEELLEWGDGYARARLVVREDNLFLREGRLDAVVTLEYMAQTVAACLGMDSRTSGGGVRVGMVIACPEMIIERASIEVGEELFTEAQRVRGSDYSSHFHTRILDAGGEMIARAKLTLVHGEAPPA